MDNKSRRLGKKLLLSAVSTALALLAAEGVVRLAGAAPASDAAVGPPIYRVDGVESDRLGLYAFDHPVLSIRLRPGYSRRVVSFWDCRPIVVETDDRGFRKSLSVPDPGRRRVMVIGDSVTYGEGANAEETFVEQMNRSQAARHFMNFGVGDAGPGTYEAILRYYGPEVRPDEIVVVVFLGNDLHNLSRDRWPELDEGRPPHGRVENLDQAFEIDPPIRGRSTLEASALVRLFSSRTGPSEKNTNGEGFSAFARSTRYLDRTARQIALSLEAARADAKDRAVGLVEEALERGHYSAPDAEAARRFLANVRAGRWAGAFELQETLSKYAYPSPESTSDLRFEFNRAMVELRSVDHFARRGLPVDRTRLLASLDEVRDGLSGVSESARAAHAEARNLCLELRGRTLDLSEDRKSRLRRALGVLVDEAERSPALRAAFDPARKLELVTRAWADRARVLEARLYIVLVPAEYQLESLRRGQPPESWSALREPLIRFGKERDVPILDLSGWMVEEWHRRRGGLYVDWSHFTPAGHRAVADRILEFLSGR